ncbi:hypothetical protein SteCoe_16394 [Stentor coeruleus]|uniref:Uncharacterized protein n=1 Tax=Stentor coeruleus TaxID=5963 RepID=A0A1R2C1D3_9CILI|nr:hypothetical protein SteCoe_16394 [Stentor coeruleus]
MDLKSIARSLAASEAQTRSEGFNLLSSYLPSTNLNYPDILKLWKSLFYYLWMADRNHNEVSEQIVKLKISTKKASWPWCLGFYETMHNEWDGIDSVRIDKFMYLVRLFTRETLHLAVTQPEEWVKVLQVLIEKSAVKGIALLFHVADVYLDEMPEVDEDMKMLLVSPFVELMKKTRLNQVCDMVYSRILLRISEKSSVKLSEWVYTQATSQNDMTSKAREKFYDLYALLKGHELPSRQGEVAEDPVKSKKDKQKHKKNLKTKGESKDNEEIPDALNRVLEEFYEQSENLKVLKIGKDTIELKHEKDVHLDELAKKKHKEKSEKNGKKVKNDKKVKNEKKSKKAKNPKHHFEEQNKEHTEKSVEISNSQVEVPISQKKSLQIKEDKKVKFNLKMNSTKVFDKKNIINSGSLTQVVNPARGILKRRPATKSSGPTKKRKLQ